jgi:hypothetical protein
MRTYVRKLQSKPEIVRKQILIGSMIVSMSFVGFVWIKTLGYRFYENKITKQEEQVKPFALLKQLTGETVENITASIGNASSSIKGGVDVSENTGIKTDMTGAIINTKTGAVTKTMASEPKKDSNVKVEKIIDLIAS